MRTVALDDLRAGLAQAERDRAEFGFVRYAERVARASRWLDVGADASREAFAGAAAELIANADGDGQPWLWARIGGLWHLAGDEPQARSWLARVAKERKLDVEPATRAGALYLLGELRKARKADERSVAGQLAEIARTASVERLAPLRVRLVELAMDVSDGPHQVDDGDPLTEWDWLEETFLLEARLTGGRPPSHREMLEQLGILSEGPGPVAPPPHSPAAELRFDLPSGAWIDALRSDYVELFVPPQLTLALRSDRDLWGAWLPDAPHSSGEWIVDAVYPDWRHAGVEAAERIRADVGDREGRTVAELIAGAGGEAGVPVPVTRLAGPGSTQETEFPTIEFAASNIVEAELAEDLVVEFRDAGAGWYGRVAPDSLTLMDDVVPAGHASWQDAARALVSWLERERAGHGAAALRELLDRH